MTALFTVNVGLMVWTVVTFLLLVFILARFGWGPLVRAIEEREERLRREREEAEAARKEAQRIQGQLAEQLAAIDAKAQAMLDKAAREAEALRERMRVQADSESKKLLEKTRQGLEEERRRLVGELRQEAAELSVLAAERIVRRSIDPSVRKAALEDFLRDVGAKGN